MYEYICSYCPFKCETHPMIIENACSRHQPKPLQFRKVVVHPSSGKFGYSRILYNELIPSELEVNIKSENSGVIVVTVQSSMFEKSRMLSDPMSDNSWKLSSVGIWINFSISVWKNKSTLYLKTK